MLAWRLLSHNFACLDYGIFESLHSSSGVKWLLRFIVFVKRGITIGVLPNLECRFKFVCIYRLYSSSFLLKNWYRGLYLRFCSIYLWWGFLKLRKFNDTLFIKATWLKHITLDSKLSIFFQYKFRSIISRFERWFTHNAHILVLFSFLNSLEQLESCSLFFLLQLLSQNLRIFCEHLHCFSITLNLSNSIPKFINMLFKFLANSGENIVIYFT